MEAVCQVVFWVGDHIIFWVVHFQHWSINELFCSRSWNSLIRVDTFPQYPFFATPTLPSSSSQNHSFECHWSNLMFDVTSPNHRIAKPSATGDRLMLLKRLHNQCVKLRSWIGTCFEYQCPQIQHSTIEIPPTTPVGSKHPPAPRNEFPSQHWQGRRWFVFSRVFFQSLILLSSRKR